MNYKHFYLWAEVILTTAVFNEKMNPSISPTKPPTYSENNFGVHINTQRSSPRLIKILKSIGQTGIVTVLMLV